MNANKLQFTNCLVLLMGLPGVGKLTVGRMLAKKSNFKLVTEWTEPVLKLFGDDYRVMDDLDTAAWKKLTAADDLILSTLAEVCPRDNSYVITQMMFAQDPYHQDFYDKILAVVTKRQANFVPVRLLCDESELITRVQTEGRKQYFKTRDVELARSRSHEQEVFVSHHPNELTVDNSHKTPDEVVEIIIGHMLKCSRNR